MAPAASEAARRLKAGGGSAAAAATVAKRFLHFHVSLQASSLLSDKIALATAATSIASAVANNRRHEQAVLRARMHDVIGKLRVHLHVFDCLGNDRAFTKPDHVRWHSCKLRRTLNKIKTQCALRS
jgi:mRNA-degrading endonuclease toxin of MazEF toxin-antitoxin module